jgi:hypothetical protein
MTLWGSDLHSAILGFLLVLMLPSIVAQSWIPISMLVMESGVTGCLVGRMHRKDPNATEAQDGIDLTRATTTLFFGSEIIRRL